MFYLEAPWPSIQTISLLPNPVLGDSDNLRAEILTKRAMDGTLYTYVKKKDSRKRLVFNFRTTRMKGMEIKEFYRSYAASRIKIQDHLDRVWIGNFMTSPLELEFTGAWKSERYPHGELITLSLEFEAVRAYIKLIT